MGTWAAVAAITVAAPAAQAQTALTQGVTVTGLSGAAGSTRDYTLVVPSGATGLSFTLSGGTGDADLYVRRGAQFKGEPRSSEQVMGRAQLSSQKPIDVFKGKKYAEPLRAYQALVTTQQRAGLYSMACAAGQSLASA
ncbi:MAG: PPC domain-containing protein [Roseateles sp.]